MGKHNTFPINQVSDVIGYDLDTFCSRHNLSSADKTTFLSRLLYATYYERIKTSSFQEKTPEYKECFLLAALADFLSETKLKKILKVLSERLTLALVQFCGFNLQEGAWKTMRALTSLYAKNNEWQQLLTNIRQKYYDVCLLEDLLKAASKPNVKSIIEQLEKQADQQVRKIHSLLPYLLNLLLTYPSRTNSPNAQSEQLDLAILFGEYLNQQYTIEEMRTFFRLFGLNDFYTSLAITNSELSDLPYILEKLNEILKNPNPIQKEAFEFIVEFLLALCRQLYAFNRKPDQYIKGLSSVVYALPTRGRNLTELPWLPSVIEGLKSIATHAQTKLRDFPIVIFDQSPSKQFQGNKKTLQILAKQERIALWHISSTQAVNLAKKLKLQDWIPLTPQGNFGYAAARNCVYLIAPVIREAATKGIKSAEAILKLKPKLLREWFEAKTLGVNGSDTVIAMGEDDVDILPCNFFADALFAFHHQDEYFQRESYFIGRSTWYANPYLDPASVLANPGKATSITLWDYKPRIHGSIGLLTKPRFCLPIYFGNEEQHATLKKSSIEYFQQLPLHLAGTRFPTKALPHSPLDGLEQFLSPILPHTMQISLSISLIDPQNALGRNILPWNDLELDKIKQFSNLNDLWHYALSKKTLKIMKERFWKNLTDLADEDLPRPLPIKQDIERLVHADLSVPMPPALKQFYERIQVDACMFMALARDIARTQSLKSSIKTVEKAFGLKVGQTQLTKDLSILILMVESFGKSQTAL